MKVLIIGNPSPHYGTDFLYSGMRRLLGPENVACLPTKPSHTAPLFAAPWNLGIQPGEDPFRGVAPETVAWDLLINVCVRPGDPDGESIKVLAALPPTPLLIVDQEDYWHGPEAFYVGQHTLIGDLHREMPVSLIETHDRLSMCYPIAHGLFGDFRVPRPLDLFCVLSDSVPQRREVIEHLQAYPWPSGFTARFAYGQRPLPVTEYLASMRTAKMAVSDFGGGQDTNRFWEILCNGALLLSRRFPTLPVGYPQPDREAVYWDTPADLVEIVLARLADPEGTLKIATAGHALGVANHTDLARARQVIAYAKAKLAVLEAA